jgi:hypothetical protein
MRKGMSQAKGRLKAQPPESLTPMQPLILDETTNIATQTKAEERVDPLFSFRTLPGWADWN